MLWFKWVVTTLEAGVKYQMAFFRSTIKIWWHNSDFVHVASELLVDKIRIAV